MLSRHRRGISLFILLSFISCAQCLTPHASDLSSFGKVKHRRTRRKHKKESNLDRCKDISSISIHHDAASINASARGGGDAQVSKPPSIYWAILHNWLYFMSLGMNLINIQFLVREIVDGDAKASPSAKSIALSGKVESVDKLLTFLGIGFLSALSDKFGRKPLM